MRVALVLSLALGLSAVAFAGSEDRSLEIAGATRTYRLHLPAKGEKPYPLVVVLHGAGADGKITEALTGFDAIADREGFAVVYPDGRRRLWAFADLRGENADVAFIGTLIDTLVTEGV